MSTSAASHLSPAFPMRAPWGTASALRAWQEEALSVYLGRSGPAAAVHRRGMADAAHPGHVERYEELQLGLRRLEAEVVYLVPGTHRGEADVAAPVLAGRALECQPAREPRE